MTSDFDDEEPQFMSYDDKDLVDMMEEPVAISRVRAYALAQDPKGRHSKVTLESARDKLDRVKATREKLLTKRKLEKFLSDFVDAEFQERSTVVNPKRFSVEKALAKLEAVKIKKEIAKSEVDRHVNTYVSPPPGRTSRIASEGASVDAKIAHEGVWVRHAKVKLDSAKEKKLKSSRKRSSRSFGSKKRNGQRKSTVGISCVDRKKEGVDCDATSAPDSLRVAVECVLAKEASVKGKKQKVPKQKAVRVSERIANSRLRLQQALLTLNVKAAILCSIKTKVRRNKRNKPEESSFKICTDSCQTKKEREATYFERDTESSIALPLDFTSSMELTTPTKRRKIQQMLVGTSSPGTRLSAGVECVPPVSPYGLIQEHLYQDPWKVLVACMLLNKTGGRQMHKVIWDFLSYARMQRHAFLLKLRKLDV